MQPTPIGPASWILWLVQPAIILAGTGIFVRLLLWPALKNLMRTELTPELKRLDEHHEQIRTVESQSAANTAALAALVQVPVTLARIEENMKILMERRHAARE